MAAAGLVIAGLVWTVLGYAALSRGLAGRGSPLLGYVALVVLTAGLLGAITHLQGGSIFDVFGVVVTYGFLAELYLFVFTLVENSVALSCLSRLTRHTSMPFEVLSRSYGVEAMVGRRLERMAAGGLVEVHAGRYALTAKGRRLVGLFDGLSKVTGRGGKGTGRAGEWAEAGYDDRGHGPKP